MKIFFNTFYYLVAFGALSLGLLLVLLQSSIVPGYEVRIVQSGSMEPAISTGSVVVIQKKDSYLVGQVVTFGEQTQNSIPTTHRIISTEVQDGKLVYLTKGDANEEVDVDQVALSDIRGVVLFTIPALGFLLDFARQPAGFALLIGLPAALIIFEEISKIVAAVREEKRKKEKGEADTDNSASA